MKLSKRSLELFKLYADDAANWSGIPPVGGNVGGSKADRGNLTQLKQAGLIRTQTEEGMTWILFTHAAKLFAAQTFNIELENTLKPEAADTAQEKIEMTETTTATATETKPAKTAKPKTAKAKPAKTAKPKTGDAHAFLPSKDEPWTKCAVCSGSPSDKRHRRALGRMRQVWRNGTHTEKALHLTHIGFDGSDAKATWTALTVEVKHLLAAALAKAEAK